MGQYVERVHASVLLHGGSAVELIGQQVRGIGQDRAKLRVGDKPRHVTARVAQEVRHLADVQHVDLAACSRQKAKIKASVAMYQLKKTKSEGKARHSNRNISGTSLSSKDKGTCRAVKLSGQYAGYEASAEVC